MKRLNETWHNAEYGKPAPHLREAIEATRLIMQQAGEGEPIRYEGDYYDIDIKGWVRPHPARRESVPIYAAAVQAGMARMAGDVADGLIGHPIQSLRWIDEVVVDSFEAGLRRSGRERRAFDYLPTVCCAIDEDEARAIEMARRTISFYATVKTYMPLWELHGFAGNAVEPPARPSAAAISPQFPLRSAMRWSRPTVPQARSTRCGQGCRRPPSEPMASSRPRPPTSSPPRS